MKKPGTDRYSQYMVSATWAEKRQERLDVDGYCCQTCGSCEDLEVHHKYAGPPLFHYPYRLGKERLSDLITLCRHCHEAITDSVRRRKHQLQGVPAIVDHQNQRPLRSFEHGPTVLQLQDQRDCSVDRSQRRISRPVLRF